MSKANSPVQAWFGEWTSKVKLTAIGPTPNEFRPTRMILSSPDPIIHYRVLCTSQEKAVILYDGQEND